MASPLSRTKLDLLVLSLPDIYAAPGSIFIDADGATASSYTSLKSSGALNPRAGAGVIVSNKTPFTMQVNNIKIADSKKVVISNGVYTVLTPGNVYVNNVLVGTDGNTPGDEKTIHISQDAYLKTAYDVGDAELPGR